MRSFGHIAASRKSTGLCLPAGCGAPLAQRILRHRLGRTDRTGRASDGRVPIELWMGSRRHARGAHLSSVRPAIPRLWRRLRQFPAHAKLAQRHPTVRRLLHPRSLVEAVHLSPNSLPLGGSASLLLRRAARVFAPSRQSIYCGRASSVTRSDKAPLALAAGSGPQERTWSALSSATSRMPDHTMLRPVAWAVSVSLNAFTRA